MMAFDEILTQVIELLQREGRVSYRALKMRFNLDDEYIEGLKDELIEAKQLAVDERGKVLVWKGDSSTPQTSDPGLRTLDSSRLQTLDPRRDAGERRQLTVMFCDLVGSTALSAQLDPEELREVVRAYQETCAIVIRRYDGHIAQHLGDGLLVYFGYPAAHEDDAQRAVRAGLEIIQALQKWVLSPLAGERQGEGAVGAHGQWKKNQAEAVPLHVRIGIHTGLVVIGEIGSSEKREILALGETPNITARVQGHAAPNEVLVSTATFRLIHGLFEIEDRGQQELKGISTPMTLYQVVQKSAAQSRFEAAVQTGLTPLVGRAEELAL